MRVVICGAGIAGLALANRLAANGITVVLLERAPGPRPQGYLIDFFGPGYDAIAQMGLLPAVERVGYRIDEASLVDETGKRRARISYSRFAEAVDGKLISVLRPDLERVLRESLPTSVDLRFATTVTTIANESNGVRVTLDDGTELAADLLVGADGVHSAVRGHTFGADDRFVRHLGLHTAAFQYPDPRPGADNHITLTDTVDRQIGHYALRDGRVAVFAVHRAPDPGLPADPRAKILGTYGSLAPEVIRHCPDDFYYDQVAQVIMPAWSRGRVVLIGDAAHAVSLLAGQGASLGIGGAFVLADRLSRLPIDAALTDYERLWRPVVLGRQRAGRAGARWFLPRSRWELVVRRQALRLADLPVLSRVAAARITGKPTTLIADLAGA
ncbi:FAD-dependent monooxygenase [Actinokineospora globicatena]|uniref:FAD-dependent monooxygenase n=1 Tax=Actinokineospora globicatena TaxID=103729 RepID=UPI0020A3796B|nr:FAD-dependent monooxygenase [Actinokineospora globicatena]MCP2305909.1 2-polyprenyl-6-methoxyphenol hydroxylase [Actinokineospora globicatena]GLW80222.1 FAD-dependent oxidoreductase [Actinokineospora globicatena]GLW87051.1 FAD-dependent oxidoreductase [Actinokineospora globicatena]